MSLERQEEVGRGARTVSPTCMEEKRNPSLGVISLSLERSRRHPPGAASCGLQGCTFCGSASGTSAPQVGWTCSGPLPCPAHVFLQVRVLFFFFNFSPPSRPWSLLKHILWERRQHFNYKSLRLDRLDSELCGGFGDPFFCRKCGWGFLPLLPLPSRPHPPP